MKDYVITKNGEHCRNLGFDSIEGIYLTIETERDLRKRFPNDQWSHEEYIEQKHGKIMKDYICKCLKCDKLLIDSNPKEDAQMKELTGEELTMKLVNSEFFACPVCMSDEDLVDA